MRSSTVVFVLVAGCVLVALFVSDTHHGREWEFWRFASGLWLGMFVCHRQAEEIRQVFDRWMDSWGGPVVYVVLLVLFLYWLLHSPIAWWR